MGKQPLVFSLCLLSLFLLHGSTAAIQLPQHRLRAKSSCQIQQLNAREPSKRFDYEAGSTELWDSKSQEFECAGVEFVRHTIQPKGLLLPHYTNSPQLVYIIQGSGIQGNVIPGCAETYESGSESSSERRRGEGRGSDTDRHQKLRRFRQGDVLALHSGVTHWTYNDGDTPMISVAIRDVGNEANQLDSKFRDFFLAGKPQPSQGRQEERFGRRSMGQTRRGEEQQEKRNILSGFETEFLAEAFNNDPETIRKMQGREGKDDNRGAIVHADRLSLVFPEWSQQEQELEREKEQGRPSQQEQESEQEREARQEQEREQGRQEQEREQEKARQEQERETRQEQETEQEREARQEQEREQGRQEQEREQEHEQGRPGPQEQETEQEHEAQQEQETEQGRPGPQEQETEQEHEAQQEQETEQEREARQEHEREQGRPGPQEQETEQEHEAQQEQETEQGRPGPQEQETEQEHEAQQEQKTEQEREARQEHEREQGRPGPQEQETEQERETPQEQERETPLEQEGEREQDQVREARQVVAPEDDYPPRKRLSGSNGLEETLCSFRIRQNIDNPRKADVFNAKAGRITRLNSQKLPILNSLRLNADRGVLYKNAMMAPHWSMNAHTLIYVIRGSARIQVVGNQGNSVFDDEAREGQLLVVPQNFAIVKKANEQGFEWVSFRTNDNAMIGQLAGRHSAFPAMPEEVVMNAYGVSREEARSLKYNREETTLLSPVQKSA